MCPGADSYAGAGSGDGQLLCPAAPSVLLASLIVTILLEGMTPASLSASGAVAGAAGLVAYALAATWAVNRWRGIAGSVIALIPRAVVSLAAYLLLMEGK